jgi:hypothetical protein
MQEVKSIPLGKLVLWTENPRDPVDPKATNQDIVDRAVNDPDNRWDLKTLAKKMGNHFDQSELPTVVYVDGKPVVFDGNRRMALALIKAGRVKSDFGDTSKMPEFPANIPCNVCSKDIAMENILRKHSGVGSWRPLERDIFLANHMQRGKTPFLVIEEATGLISANRHLNQGFVRDELFTEENLKGLGFRVVDEKLHTIHTDEQAIDIFEDLLQKIKGKQLDTRTARRKPGSVLSTQSKAAIRANKDNELRELSVPQPSEEEEETKETTRRRTPRTKERPVFFGGTLVLAKGDVNLLYRDLVDLHDFWIANVGRLSELFPSILRMSLRPLCEAAAKDAGFGGIDQYVRAHFADAKKALTQDQKTFLFTHNVTEEKMIALLHIGAHSYKAASNVSQAYAMAIILGRMLEISHGKE